MIYRSTTQICFLATAILVMAMLGFAGYVSATDQASVTGGKPAPYNVDIAGITEPHPAPAWDIVEWINDNPGNVADNRNTVIVVDFFQLWCPGCNTFTGPLMQQWQDRFSEEIESGELLLVKIHSVFEGHDYQTVVRLKNYLIERGITMPVGVDRHLGDHLPETKKRYKTSGTPEVVIIDQQGNIRFQQFGWFDPPVVERYIEYLLGSSGSSKRDKPVEVCLASDLCG